MAWAAELAISTKERVDAACLSIDYLRSVDLIRCCKRVVALVVLISHRQKSLMERVMAQLPQAADDSLD